MVRGHTPSFARSVLGGLVLTAPALCQQSTLLLDQGDDIPGAGPFDRVHPYENCVAVNDQGDWAAAVQLDAPNAGNSVLLRNGAILLQEGTVLPSGSKIVFSGGSWSSFNGVCIDEAGRVLCAAVLEEDIARTALMLDTDVLLETGDPFPSPDVPAGSTVRTLFPRAILGNGRLAVGARLHAPGVTDFFGLAVLEVDAGGQITGISVPYQRDEPAPGIGIPLASLDREVDLDDAGVLAWRGLLDTGSFDDDGVAFVGDLLLAREGEASPIPGWQWTYVGLPSTTSAGDSWCLNGTASPGSGSPHALLVQDGVVRYRAGDVLPATAPHGLDSITSVSRSLADSGELYWLGGWAAEDPRSKSAVFVDDEAWLVRAQTLLSGYALDDFPTLDPDRTAISDNGRYALLANRLQGRYALVLTDRQAVAQDPCLGPDDALEDNDDAGHATSLAPGWHNHLLVTRTDEDWTQVTLGAGKVLEVVASHSFEAGDLDIALFESDGTTLLAQSTKAEDDEWVAVGNPGGVAKSVLVRVSLAPLSTSDCAPYRLMLDVHAPSGCVGLSGPADDTFEPNDDGPSAAPLPVGWTTGLVVHPYDKDFYRFPVPAGATVTLVANHHENGGFAVLWYLLRAQSGGPVVAGTSVASPLQTFVQWTNTTGAPVEAELELAAEGMSDTACMGYDLLLGIAGEVGSAYCTPKKNSTGVPARCHATGSDVASDNLLTLVADRMPPQQFGYQLVSQTQGYTGAGSGVLCLGGSIGRLVKLVQSTGSGGTFSVTPDLTHLPPPTKGSVLAGETWSFQAWFRDGSKSNFTNGVAVLFH